jgi:hypothetical protein
MYTANIGAKIRMFTDDDLCLLAFWKSRSDAQGKTYITSSMSMSLSPPEL